ncbi:MAG: proteasome accessory factor PafA2 family protein [Planctomycetes bacterium]|nr:proteasome accessory factor PafA2 family protein [Planctomycetota bacterium]
MTQERPAILGLETEHLLFFAPDPSRGPPAGPGDPRPGLTGPEFQLAESVLFDSLLSGRKAAVSSGLKGGYFLENGGLAHLEICLQGQHDTPILEMCTPECRGPHDLLLYARAGDAILEETSRRSEERLRFGGHEGRIAFGKSNRDARGVGFGCHENYLVHRKATRTEQALVALAMPLLFACYLPVFLVFVAVLVLSFAWLALTRLPALEGLAARTARWLAARAPWVPRACRGAYFVATTAVHYPFFQIYSLLIKAALFRVYIRSLTAHLVTRQVLTGAGRLDFERGVYELSQRAGLTSSLARIVLFGRRKTIFDLKCLLYDRSGLLSCKAPLALFLPTRRLSIVSGDSNLSDVPNLLKVGTTLLLIEMIEAGESFDDLRLARPVRSMRAVSREGPWKQLRLRSGETLTALEVQRELLRRAQTFFRSRPEGRVRHGEILRLWEECLEDLAERPQALADRLDWAAKKSLLDRRVLATTNWRVFFAWGRVFTLAGLREVARAPAFDALLRRLGPLRRLRVRRAFAAAGLDASEYRAQRDLHFEARKIDLRYHELGGESGYQRLLEKEGFIRRLTADEDVARAVKSPPSDTRARVRGYYIQRSQRPDMLQVSWNEIELMSPPRNIPTPDPFAHRLPGE